MYLFWYLLFTYLFFKLRGCLKDFIMFSKIILDQCNMNYFQLDTFLNIIDLTYVSVYTILKKKKTFLVRFKVELAHTEFPLSFFGIA